MNIGEEIYHCGEVGERLEDIEAAELAEEEQARAAELRRAALRSCFMCGGKWEPTDEDVAKDHDQCAKCRRIRHRDWYESQGGGCGD